MNPVFPTQHLTFRQRAIMDQSIGTATNVFQTQGEIIVNNHFPASDPLIWARSIAAASVESMLLFDSKKRLIFYNNKYGTLDDAEPNDLRDLYSLFRYYGKVYRNAEACLNIVKQVFLFRTPEKFTLENYSGWTCDCRVYPVLDGMQLGGVVLLAHRDGPALPVGENYREQSPRVSLEITPNLGDLLPRLPGRNPDRSVYFDCFNVPLYP